MSKELSMSPANVRARKYRAENLKKIRTIEKKSQAKRIPDMVAYNRAWREANREKNREYYRAYRLKNLDKLRAQGNAFYAANQEKRRKQSIESAKRSPDKIRARNVSYYHKNKEKLSADVKSWLSKNQEWVKEYRKAYGPRRRELRKIRWATDPLYRLREGSRRTIGDALREGGIAKSHRTFELIGCTVEFYKAYLEERFDANMTWENWGTYWEIDHTIPLASFDLRDEAQLKNAFHYSNCRPLIKLVNRQKHDSMPEPHQAELV